MKRIITIGLAFIMMASVCAMIVPTEAEAGDVVYAATVMESPEARTAFLHFGASSQAQIWLNGSDVGYVPNEKGVRRDEFVTPLELREGKNVLVVKLQRFWERHWMFYASLSDQ